MPAPKGDERKKTNQKKKTLRGNRERMRMKGLANLKGGKREENPPARKNS